MLALHGGNAVEVVEMPGTRQNCRGAVLVEVGATIVGPGEFNLDVCKCAGQAE